MSGLISAWASEAIFNLRARSHGTAAVLGVVGALAGLGAASVSALYLEGRLQGRHHATIAPPPVVLAQPSVPVVTPTTVLPTATPRQTPSHPVQRMRGFLMTYAGRPLTVARGRHIVVAYNGRGAPYRAARLVHRAVARVSRAGGRPIRFIAGRAARRVRARHGRVLIRVGWVRRLSRRRHGTDILGLGTAHGHGAHLIAGQVKLAFRHALRRGTGRDSEFVVVLHELGHSIGDLAHDRSGAMSPTVNPHRRPGFSLTERTRLRRVLSTAYSHQ